MRSQVILAGIIAIVGASLPALPAVADEVPAPPSAATEPTPHGTGVIATDQFIVKFKDRYGIKSADRQASFGHAASAVGVPVQAVRTTATGEDVVKTDRRLGTDEAKELVAALASDPNVEYAEPDVIMRAFSAAPNDTHYPIQWAHSAEPGGIHVREAWDYSQGEGAVVAVIDTGILDHSDLNPNILPGYDMISTAAVARDGNGRDADPTDKGDYSSAGQCGVGEPAEPSSWHGTHVSGIIAAVAGNGKGIAGVAPKAKVVPVRVLGLCGGYTSDITDGIVWAVGGNVPGVPVNPNPARVVNLSLGAEAACPSAFQSALDFASTRNASVVVAAGNENMDATYVSPANCRNVITVAASTRAKQRAYYSNYGNNVDLSAPGGDMRYQVTDGVVSTLNNGRDVATGEEYYIKAGTSMAAPHVSAVAGMITVMKPSATPFEVEQRLRANISLMSYCAVCGTGLLNAAAALKDVWMDVTPIVPSKPTIEGKPQVGETLSAYTSPWVPVGRLAMYYQWNRNGVPIPDGYPFSYTLTPEDLGATITITQTGVRADGASASAVSLPTAPIGPGPLAALEPTISGSAYVGSVLTAETGTWEPSPVVHSYQWNLGGIPIDGAVNRDYTVVNGDAGKPISVTVTGDKLGYTTQSLSSKPTVAVVPADKVVSPLPVTFAEAPYMEDDRYTIPTSPGVKYQVDGVTVAAGLHLARGQVRVVATAEDGYMLRTGAPALWTAYFSMRGPNFTAPAVSPFKDVLTTQQFYKEMSWLADRKISAGWTDVNQNVTYRPLTAINRDAMAAFLYRMAGSPEYTPPVQSPFKDVLTTQQFYKEMAWLAETGISSGWTENGARLYKPLTPINRDAMAAFLYRLANKPDYVAPPWLPFNDVSASQQFYKEMAWMYESGISSGWTDAYGSRTYQPLSPVNRDAMAAFLYRMP